MLRWLESNKVRRRIATDLYEKIVAQARSTAFFRDQGVPDTMEGRFEMIAMHIVLVLQRLKPEGDAGQRLGQMLMEQLIADMDDALRQIGIGDMGVPRRIQKTAAALRERAEDYGGALAALSSAEGEAETTRKLAAAVTRHVFGTAPGDIDAAAKLATKAGAIVNYMCQAFRQLAEIPIGILLAGEIAFPDAPAAASPLQEAP